MLSCTIGSAALAVAAGLTSIPPVGAGPSTGAASVLSVHTLEQPLQLSVLFPLIPAKLVVKIRSGGFIDMKDLLPDNLVLQKQPESLQSSKQASKAKLREVRSVSTWLYGFLAYMAAATSDTRT